MEPRIVSRKRPAIWGRKDTAEALECTSPNWGSVLVEELLETNVIPDRHMAILKEQSHAEVTIDPALVSNLRHDKEIRSALYSVRSQPSNVEIVKEAKRILKREEKEKKSISMQNKIVDDEVDRFQNHITSLRKMNQRLERIAFPAPNVSKRRQSKFQYGHSLSARLVTGSESVTKLKNLPNEPAMFIDYKKQRNKNKNQIMTKIENTKEADDSLPTNERSKSSLSISGQKMDEHDILQHNPVHTSQNPSVCQNTVFERIHLKYVESERSRVLLEGAACIRHSSPVNDCRHSVAEPTTSNWTHLPVCMNSNNSINLGEWIEDISYNTDLGMDLIQKPEVCIDEWSLPTNVGREAPRTISESEKHESSQTLPPAVVSKKEQNKLESMSKMYAKWMTKVCVTPNSQFRDFGSFKSKLEKDKEVTTKQQTNLSSISREEKIMQVLQALQKHKEGKTNSEVNTQHAGSSRFSKSVNDIREEKTDLESLKTRRAISGSYENRLRAHKELITHQKVKLEDQRKQIEELKLSQLKVESEKSQMLTQKTLNEVLGSCNENVKAQAKSLKASLSLVDLSPGNDFVLRMERRAIEQKQKKLLSQERRKQLEEERKRKIKEMEDKRHLEEEELIRKKLEEARETRRKEREMREEARREREHMIALERKADYFLKIKRLRYGLRGFKKLVSLRKVQEDTAISYYDNYLMRLVWKKWRREVEVRANARLDCADQFYASNLLLRCFSALKTEVLERTQRFQVAMDMHDLHLQERYFHLWIQFTHKQQEIEAEKAAKADLYFSNLLVRRYLHLWQKYPKIAQLEREKERRKMMWRNKVQQLLPDFRPVLTSD